MSQRFDFNSPIPMSDARLAETFTSAIQRVYFLMATGLMLTAGIALTVATSEALMSFIFGTGLFLGLIIAELILVLALSWAINRLSPGVALVMFYVYATLNGATLAIIFQVYELGTISLAFGVTAVLFGVMSLIGYTTKEDLTGWRNILLMGLLGLIIASVANLFLANSTLDWIITYAGILIFLALTVYDTQYIKRMTYAYTMQGDSAVVSRIGVLGALKLYLDFINLFLFILRALGRRR